MMIQRNNFFVSLLIIFVSLGFENSCYYNQEHSRDSVYMVMNDDQLIYDLNNPADKFDLPDELVEVSGLAFYRNNQILCIQDEDGKAFLYDTFSKNIIYDEKFDKDDDYEGVEIVDRFVYVVNSAGDLFHFELKLDPEADKIKTPLSDANDVEGLGYLPSENFLLLACKERAQLSGGKTINGKAVYAFDIEQKKLLEEPFLIIQNQEIVDLIKENDFSMSKHFPFKPSAIAVHPVDQSLYILASVGKLLIVVNKNKELQKIIPLPPEHFIQPEGICFDRESNLFIANEGNNGKANILKFSNELID